MSDYNPKCFNHTHLNILSQTQCGGAFAGEIVGGLGEDKR